MNDISTLKIEETPVIPERYYYIKLVSQRLWILYDGIVALGIYDNKKHTYYIIKIDDYSKQPDWIKYILCKHLCENLRIIINSDCILDINKLSTIEKVYVTMLEQNLDFHTAMKVTGVTLDDIIPH